MAGKLVVMPVCIGGGGWRIDVRHGDEIAGVSMTTEAFALPDAVALQPAIDALNRHMANKGWDEPPVTAEAVRALA